MKYSSAVSKCVFLPMALAAIGVWAPSAHAANWTAGGGTFAWANDAHWSATDYPGKSGATDNNVNRLFAPNAGDLTTNLSTNLAENLIGLRMDAGQGISTMTLNVSADLNVTNVGNNALWTINEGGPNSPSARAVANITAGTVTFDQLRMARDEGTSEFNISGTANVTFLGSGGGNSITMRPDAGANGKAIFSVAGGTFAATGNSQVAMSTFDSQFLITGGSVTMLNNPVNMDAATAIGATSLLQVTGSAAGGGPTAIQFGSLDLFRNAANTTGSATASLTLDTGGITPIAVGTLNLGTGSDKGQLVIAPGTWDGVSGLDNGNLVLFDYTTLNNGLFGSVSLVGMGGTIDYAYDLGGGDLGIALLNAAIIPEGSSLSLAALGLLGLLGFRHRRRR